MTIPTVDPISGKYEAIIFDFDGVIAESVDVKTKAFAALYSEYGDDIVEQVVAYHLENGGVSRFDKFRYYHEVLLGKTLTKSEEHNLGDRFSQNVEDAVVHADYVAGAKEFLDCHYQVTPLYVASATPEQELQRIVARRDMQKYFVGIYGSPRKKGEIITNIIADGKYDPQRVVMVGDAISDYEGAIAAGVKFVGRVLKYPDPSPFPRGTRVMPDLTQFSTNSG